MWGVKGGFNLLPKRRTAQAKLARHWRPRQDLPRWEDDDERGKRKGVPWMRGEV